MMVVPWAAAATRGTEAPRGPIPDPYQSICPEYVHVVGSVEGGAAADPFGQQTIQLLDFAGYPSFGWSVTLDLSGCCDIRLCGAIVNGQPVGCADGRVTGFTDDLGYFRFTLLGAASDPGTSVPPACWPGAGANGVRVVLDYGMEFWHPTALCLDQNGAATPPGSNGTSISDVSALFILFGAVSLGGSQHYRGRGDLNADGQISIADVAHGMGHLGRLVLAGGVGCLTPYCPVPGCP
jgi:hypothetical protein